MDSTELTISFFLILTIVSASVYYALTGTLILQTSPHVVLDAGPYGTVTIQDGTYANVTVDPPDYVSVAPSACSDDEGDAVLSNVQVSDDVYETTDVRKEEGWIQCINTVNVTVEHHEKSTDFDYLYIQAWDTDTSTWDTVQDLTGSQVTSDTNVTVDITGWINGLTDPIGTVNALKVRIMGYHGAPAKTIYLDCMELHVTYTAPAGKIQTYDPILNVTNNHASLSYEVKLKLVDYSGINIIDNLTIWLHDGGGNSKQIEIISGSVTQSEGSFYSLAASSKDYIALYVDTSTSGTIYLKINLIYRTGTTVTATYLIEIYIT